MALLILSFAFMIVMVLPSYDASRREAQTAKELDRDRHELQREIDERTERITRLYSDDYIELIARRDFGMVKPGEKSYIFIFPEEKEATATGHRGDDTPSRGSTRTLLDLLRPKR